MGVSMSSDSLHQYKERIEDRIQSLRSIFAYAAIGDFSRDVPSYDPENELSEIFVGVQVMLDVIREKIDVYESIKKDLEKKIAEEQSTQTALLNVLEDEEFERRNAQEERKKYDIIATSIGEGVIAVNTQERIIFINNIAASLLKRSKEECLHQPVRSIIHLFRTDKKELQKEDYPFTRVLASGETLIQGTGEEPYFAGRSDGSYLPVAFTLNPVAVNGIVGAVIVFRDATAEVERSRMRSEFITIASHQLKSPMTIIRWAAEWIEGNEKLSKDGIQFLNDLHAACIRLTSLTDLLLNVSRLEEGVVAVTIQRIDIRKLIRDYLVLIEPYAKEHEIAITAEKKDTPISIESDSALVSVVVQILITNALDYTPSGGSIAIDVEHMQISVRISIRDTGIGIPLHEQSSIFEKFKRAENAKKMKVEGTGLGLYTAKKIIDLLGGTIIFQSREGVGSTFVVELPIKSKSRKGTKHLVS